MTEKDALTLNWYRRLEIALSVAQGLDYLHTFAVRFSLLIIYVKIKNHVIILENVLRVFFLYKNQVERKFAITIPTLCYL